MSTCILFVDRNRTVAWKGKLEGAFQKVYEILVGSSPSLPCSEPSDEQQLYAKMPQMEEGIMHLLGIFLFDHISEQPKTYHPNKRGDYFKDIAEVLREIAGVDTALVLRQKGREKVTWGLGMFYHSSWQQEFDELPGYLEEVEVHTIFRSNNYLPYAFHDQEHEEEEQEEMFDEEEEHDEIQECILNQMQRVNLVPEDGEVSAFVQGGFQLPSTGSVASE